MPGVCFMPQVESCLALMSMAGLERFATKQTLMVRGLGCGATACASPAKASGTAAALSLWGPLALRPLRPRIQ